MLQLLSNGILIVVGGKLLVLELRHGHTVSVGVAQGLLVDHVLGIYIAALVRVDSGVVQAKVVLVGAVPALPKR